MKNRFLKIWNHIWTFLADIHWFGLFLGVVAGFVVSSIIFFLIEPFKTIVGSVLGSMISAGTALFVLYHQEKKQNEKDNQRLFKEDSERKRKRLKTSKRIEYIKKQLSSEATEPAYYYSSFSNDFDKFSNLFSHNKIVIEDYINELDKFNIDLIDEEKFDDYLKMLEFLKRWDREINKSFVIEDIGTIGKKFIELRDEY